MELTEITALAERCVRCGLCLPQCPTYLDARTESEGPRGRIAIMDAVLRGHIAATPAAHQHVHNCLGCGRCEEVCPAQVQYQTLRDQYRARYQSRRRRWLASALSRPGLRAAMTFIARWLHWWPQALLPATFWRSGWRLQRTRTTAPECQTPSVTRAPAPAMLFRGCQATALDPRAQAAAALSLAALDAPVLATQSGCCGALAQHEGALATAHQQRQHLAEDSTELVALDSGCIADLRRSGRGVIEICRYLLDHWPAHWQPNALPRAVGLHLPCTHRNSCGDTTAVIELLERIPGLQLHHLSGRGCCGAGGMNMLMAPEQSARFAANLLQELPEDVTTIVSTNIGCRAHLRSQRADLDIRHPVELLLEAMPQLAAGVQP